LPILILEGDLHQAGSIHPAALLGAISSLVLKLNIFILQTTSPQETAAMVIALAKKEQMDQPNKKFSIRFKKVPSQINRQLEFIIAGIPGINISRAQDLLSTFETVQNIFNASSKELQNVPNIGPVIADSIQKFATSKYQKDRENQ
jgi:Fanconi anemia group M protein